MTDIEQLALRYAEAAGAKGFHWEGSLYDFVEPFLAAYLAEQEPLPPDMAKVLHEHLWDLYERRDTLEVGADTTTHNATVTCLAPAQENDK